MATVDPRLDLISKSIRVVPDFPKAGIQFQDVTTILLNPEAFQATTDLLVEHYRDQHIDVVAGRHRQSGQRRMPALHAASPCGPSAAVYCMVPHSSLKVCLSIVYRKTILHKESESTSLQDLRPEV